MALLFIFKQIEDLFINSHNKKIKICPKFFCSNLDPWWTDYAFKDHTWKTITFYRSGCNNQCMARRRWESKKQTEIVHKETGGNKLHDNITVIQDAGTLKEKAVFLTQRPCHASGMGDASNSSKKFHSFSERLCIILAF